MLGQQLRQVLALQCERIVCLASGIAPQLVELQHQAERHGASFHLIAGPRALAGLVTAGDEVIVLEDGLLAPLAELQAQLVRGQGVLVQPIEQGLEAGFGRIDLNHASAGAIRIPGRLIERLAELPGDCDAFAALERIALQAGLTQLPIPSTSQRGPLWSLVRDENEAHVLEPLWIRLRTRIDGPLGPSRWLALAGVRRFGPAMLHAGSGAKALAIGAALLALMGGGAGWLGLVPLGMLMFSLGWLARQAAVFIARIDFDDAPGLAFNLRSETAYGWVLDVLIVALCGWTNGAGQLERYFPAAMLVALLRILPRSLGPRWAAWLDDRAVLALLLAAAMLTGVGREAVLGLATLLAITGIVLPSGEFRLTRP